MKLNFRKFGALAFASVMIFTACSTDGDITTHDETPTAISFHTKSLNTIKLVTVKNVDDFAANHVAITEEMEDIIQRNKMAFDTDSYDKINGAADEQELTNTLELLGMDSADAVEYVGFSKLIQSNYQDLLNADSNFANETVENQQEIISGAIGQHHDQLPLPINEDPGDDMTTLSCKKTWQIAMQRCRRAYAINLGIAVVGTIAGGGFGGIVYMAGAMIIAEDCANNANEDYFNCTHPS